MIATALHNQSLFDCCLQHTGTINGIFELAMANNLSVTDDLPAGAVLQLPDPMVTDGDIKKYYAAKAILPATAFTAEDIQIIDKPGGISIWAINIDFKVN